MRGRAEIFGGERNNKGRGKESYAGFGEGGMPLSGVVRESREEEEKIIISRIVYLASLCGLWET